MRWNSIQHQVHQVAVRDLLHRKASKGQFIFSVTLDLFMDQESTTINLHILCFIDFLRLIKSVEALGFA